LNCSVCIAAHEGPVKCGWCLGGDVIYNDTGKSPFKCAGFEEDQPKDFTCTNDFRTSDCSGVSCNWTTTSPTCYHSDHGDYPDEKTCQATCKSAQFARCNVQSRQCESCQQGSANCTQTEPQCQDTCNAPHSKCNLTTHQCRPCDPSTDPDCIYTTGYCQEQCSKASTYGICDPTTGQCVPCDPSGKDPGCVESCNSTCTYGGKYGCNVTDHTCIQGYGNMSLPDCANMCIPSNHTNGTFGCDWNQPSGPVCVTGKGTFTKEDCAINCKTPSFAKCNYTTGQCQPCKTGDPGCQYTQDYCNASCHQSTIMGTYRGIQINKNFSRGEWDFTFYGDGVMAFTLHLSNIKYEAKYELVGPATEGAPVTLTFTEAPSGGPLPINPGQSLVGLYVTSQGQDAMTNFAYLGFGNQVTTFDQGMGQYEFALTACRDTTVCDFSNAAQPEPF